MTMHADLKILTACRADVEQRALVRAPHVLVSIRDPGTPRPRLRDHPLRLDVLHLEFHDVEPSAGAVLPPEVRPMTEDDARAIWAFVRRHLESLRAVVVHCEQGSSRSPGVAAGLLWGLGRSDDRLWETHMPNAHAFGLMLTTCPLRKLHP